MKTTATTLLICAALLAGFTSCSKCYDCSHYVYTASTNNTAVADSTQVTEEYCSASSDEVKKKEQDGYVCTEQ